MEFTTPLTIHLSGGAVPAGVVSPLTAQRGGYIATCPQRPGLVSADNDASIAIVNLMELVAEAEKVRDLGLDDEDSEHCEHCGDDEADNRTPSFPTSDDDESRYGPAYITAWNELVEASHAEWDYRIHDADTTPGRHADAGLAEQWVNTGIPIQIANKFKALLLEPADAKRLHDAGRTPEDTLPYVVNAESTGWWNWPDFDIVEWVITRFPITRVRLYESRCSAAEAATWEALAALHHISDADLVAVLRADFSPASVAANGQAWAEEGHSIGDAARSYLSAAGLDRGGIRIVSGRPG